VGGGGEGSGKRKKTGQGESVKRVMMKNLFHSKKGRRRDIWGERVQSIKPKRRERKKKEASLGEDLNEKKVQIVRGNNGGSYEQKSETGGGS